MNWFDPFSEENTGFRYDRVFVAIGSVLIVLCLLSIPLCFLSGGGTPKHDIRPRKIVPS